MPHRDFLLLRDFANLKCTARVIKALDYIELIEKLMKRVILIEAPLIHHLFDIRKIHERDKLNEELVFFEANLNALFKCLVFNRALVPDSKKGAWETRGMFFEETRYALEDVSRALDYFLQWRPALLKHLHGRIQSLYGRETLLLYYDVTNYYFEIDEPDGLRKKGVSKEHRPRPIVQMGLFLDEKGPPVSYELYQGNANDSTILPSMLDDIVVEFGPHHLIVVADKGMMSGDNIARIRLLRNGYVMSYSVRGADQQFKAYVLDEEGYTEVRDSEGFLVSKHKSRVAPREIWVTTKEGTKRKVIVNERQIIIYSAAYDRRAKRERQHAIDKACQQIYSLSKDAKPSKYGAAKYIKRSPLTEKPGPMQKILNTDYCLIRKGSMKMNGWMAIMSSAPTSLGVVPKRSLFQDDAAIPKMDFFS